MSEGRRIRREEVGKVGLKGEKRGLGLSVWERLIEVEKKGRMKGLGEG